MPVAKGLKRPIQKRTTRAPLAMPVNSKALPTELKLLPRKESPAEKPMSGRSNMAIPPIQRASKKPLFGKYPA